MGKQNQWVQLPTGSGLWGRIDFDEYVHLDDPLNADMHEIVPGKLVAFRGPRDVGPRLYSDDGGYRRFGPKHYLHLFRHIGVTTVIRLNEPEYDRAEFTSNGIDHHDLVFEDCTSPPPHIIDRFFDIVDRAPGVVAVHCMASLGRTGTLIALDMMRRFKFTAREAIGWLRVMRPGSVIGPQQQFLCAVEARPSLAAELGIHGGTRELTRATDTSGQSMEEAVASVEGDREWCFGVGGADAAKRLAAEVAEGMERRGAARM